MRCGWRASSQAFETTRSSAWRERSPRAAQCKASIAAGSIENHEIGEQTDRPAVVPVTHERWIAAIAKAAREADHVRRTMERNIRPVPRVDASLVHRVENLFVIHLVRR